MLEAVVLGISGVLWPAPETRSLHGDSPNLRTPLLSGVQWEALRVLGSRYRLAFLESGDPGVLDPIAESLGLRRIVERCLWTGSLGGQARPPSALPFRWLAARMGLRASECLYVAGQPELYRAACRARWQVTAPAGSETVDLAELADSLEDPESLETRE